MSPRVHGHDGAHALSLDQAQSAIAAGIAAAARLGVAPVSLAIVDAAAHPLAFARMDGALLGSIEVARGKARTAALFQTDGAALALALQPGGGAYTMQNTHGGLVAMAGGLMVWRDDGLPLGAIGVSGASPQQDEAVARAVLEVLTGEAKD